MPGQRNRQRQLHCRADVPYVNERAVLPERLPFRSRLGAPPPLGPPVFPWPPDRHWAQGHRHDPGPRSEARAQILGEALRQSVRAHRPAGMRIIHREVIRKPLALGDPEDLGTGEVDHPGHAGGLGRQQHMPGAEHVDRHNVLRAARRVVRKRAEVHDRGATHRCPPDLGKIQEIFPVSHVKAGHLMAKALKMAGHRPTDLAAMPGDENAHAAMMSLVPGGRPPVLPRAQPGPLAIRRRAAADQASPSQLVVYGTR